MVLLQYTLITSLEGYITEIPAVLCYYECLHTFPSILSCCISCSLLPIPMNAHGWASCSVQPSFSIFSNFFCQPLPIRYTHGGGQKNLIGRGKEKHDYHIINRFWKIGISLSQTENCFNTPVQTFFHCHMTFEQLLHVEWALSDHLSPSNNSS